MDSCYVDIAPPGSDAGHFELRRRRLDFVGWLQEIGEPTPAASWGVRVGASTSVVVGFSYRDQNVGNTGGGVEVTSYPKNQLGPSEIEGVWICIAGFKGSPNP